MFQRRLASVVARALATATLVWGARAAALDPPPQDAGGASTAGASTAGASKKGGTDTKIIPLPIYATLPNEGSTFGVLPVFLVVESEGQRTSSIYAPSLSWNEVIGVSGTMRWFHYPDRERALLMRASMSQRVNASAWFVWTNRPLAAGRWTDDVLARVEKSVFFRFFGLGPDTTEAAETSHTRLRGQIDLRRGLNLGSDFNLAARFSVAGDDPVRRTVPGLPASQDVFPTVPGMSGASVVGGGFDIRYDSRPDYEFSKNGFYSDLSTRWFYGMANSPNFGRFDFETKGLLQELDRLQLAARFYASFVSARTAPFYYQSTLGGSFLLRGFTEDRFIDRGAWTAEMEQRFRLFETHIYGVTAAWRVDPFVAVGQVFGDARDAVSHVRTAAGLGLRAFVDPNVLGRIDLAVAGEGLKVYVELGYPF